MNEPNTMTYQADGRVARITLNRPERGNGITLDMPGELAACLERANLDPAIHVIALSGNGSGFCGGYDLVENAEGLMDSKENPQRPKGSPVDPMVQMKNHVPGNLCPRPSMLCVA